MATTEPALGKAIRRARERKRMSQKELGDAIGRSRSAVNAWENGRAVPANSIGALEDVLGVDLERYRETPSDRAARLERLITEADEPPEQDTG